MNAQTKGKQAYFYSLVTLFLAGCGTVYVNPEDRNLEAAARDSFTVGRTVDSAYREVFGRLQYCLSTYGYRVQGDITRERVSADVTVVSGFGFQRTLYLADSVFLKAEFRRLGPESTRVTFILPTVNAKPFADGTKRWLVTGEGSCMA